MALAVIPSQSHPPPAQPDEREDTEEPSMETLLDADDSTMRTTIDETEKVDDAAAYDFDGHPIDTTLLDEQIPINLPVATARKKFTLTTPVPPQSVSPSASLAAEFFREESLRVILRKR